MEPYETFCKQPIEECCYPEDDVWKQYFSVPWVLFWDSINTSLWHSLGDSAVKIWTDILDLSCNSGLKDGNYLWLSIKCRAAILFIDRAISQVICMSTQWDNTNQFWSSPLLVLNITWHGCPAVQLNSELLLGEGEIKRLYKS